MDLQQATEEFKSLLLKIDKMYVADFISWVEDHIEAADKDVYDQQNNSMVILDSIREDLRKIVPVNGVIPSESIIPPEVGPNADCTSQTTAYIDAFLYDEEDMNSLGEDGKIHLHYCSDCFSRNIKPLTLVTHSASTAQIRYIFDFLLPDISGKNLLDIGSRLGAILYGAYLFTNANIEGVEIDKTLCQIQENIIKKYKFEDRIKIYHGNILNRSDLLQKVDIIILNNVFEFFMPLNMQVLIWNFLHSHLQKRRVVLITLPSIEDSLKNLKTNINISEWVKEIDTSEILNTASYILLNKTPAETDLGNFHMYETL
ncbi:uncharacterized protein LOC106868885 isoform X1 [Octopus bimaculoides]|uniref:Arsenite methyltransferase n=2 Tax=Octopus bimaculoides TaxID=37653 RepID=A0A0L8HTM4_OCTBM|nr:uncharacterized protein LOC106868885 isoform X1 [Octopus bimaculoides]|eukprot:XP_014769823.1 PREDICTED: uncharacterized protein LOC106868885 isoform X1 [Octopus bimaculoides]